MGRPGESTVQLGKLRRKAQVGESGVCHPCLPHQQGGNEVLDPPTSGEAGGCAGEEGEALGCQNQLWAVQTAGQLHGVTRETRRSWSTTGPYLPRRLLLGLPTAHRVARGAATPHTISLLPDAPSLCPPPPRLARASPGKG